MIVLPQNSSTLVVMEYLYISNTLLLSWNPQWHKRDAKRRQVLVTSFRDQPIPQQPSRLQLTLCLSEVWVVSQQHLPSPQHCRGTFTRPSSCLLEPTKPWGGGETGRVEGPRSLLQMRELWAHRSYQPLSRVCWEKEVSNQHSLQDAEGSNLTNGHHSCPQPFSPHIPSFPCPGPQSPSSLDTSCIDHSFHTLSTTSPDPHSSAPCPRTHLPQESRFDAYLRLR